MYKPIFLGILEADKSQKPKCVIKKIIDFMTSCNDFIIFDVHFVFCHFSASKMPRKMVLYIFQQPSFCRIQKLWYLYPRVKIYKSIDKTVAWYHFVFVMKCNQIKWYQVTILSINLPILIKVQLFFDSAQGGLLKNVQNNFSWHLGSREIAKTQVHTFFWNTLNQAQISLR